MSELMSNSVIDLGSSDESVQNLSDVSDGTDVITDGSDGNDDDSIVIESGVPSDDESDDSFCEEVSESVDQRESLLPINIGNPIMSSTLSNFNEEYSLSDCDHNSEDQSFEILEESRAHNQMYKMAKHKREGVFRRDINEIIKDRNLNKSTLKSRTSEDERVRRLIKRLQNSEPIDKCLTTDGDIDFNIQNWIQTKNYSFNSADNEGTVLINVGHHKDEPDIYLAPKISKEVMAHQIDGIRFLFDNVIESVDCLDSTEGYGCILSHSMGLGKTVQIIALVDIFMRLRAKGTVLIVMPVNVLNNWIQEFDKWLPARDRAFSVYSIDKLNKNGRDKTIIEWHKFGGVLLIGYEKFLSITSKSAQIIEKGGPKTEIKNCKRLQSALVDSGPDIVICDEGHRIKNDESLTSRALKKIRTKRRIILTGYPLQNRLKEYYCMIDFVRPHHLGYKWEFNNTFDTPITNGQCKDSTDSDKQLMRERSHVLNQLLKGFIQRRNEDVLKSVLPNKNEFVIFCKVSAKQRELLNAFLNDILVNDNTDNSGKISLFKTFVVCSKICNHPDIIHDIIQRGEGVEEIDPEEDPQLYSYKWAQNNFLRYKKEVLSNSSKMVILFDIIEETVAIGDRLIIFSQWLFTLDLIERLLESRNVNKSDKKWKKNRNYYRLDGQTKPDEREQLVENFNSPNNKGVHLFLISTKAGGIGINLIGANRIVIFDACWNPCHDAQASCRIFRPGQSKPCFIYRLISGNSLEKRIFNKQIFKQGISKGVVDQQNIALKLNQNEVRALLVELRKELAQIEDIFELNERKLKKLKDPLLSLVCIKSQSCLTSVPIELQTLLEGKKELALNPHQKRQALIAFKEAERLNENLKPKPNENIDLLTEKLKNTKL